MNTRKQLMPGVRAVLCLIIISIFIYGCRKELPGNFDKPSTAALAKNGIDLNMLQDTYNKGTRKSIQTASTQSPVDIIKNINVDWTTYSLFTYPDSTQIIEFALPDDKSLLIPNNISPTDSTKFHSKTTAVFILRKDTVRMCFFMKTIEKANEPGYQSSIGHVRYKQMPAGFTGNVYYFTFDKQFIVGYGWDKGILAKQLSIAAGTQTQTTRRGKISTNQLALHCQDVLYDYYTYRIDENGHIFDFRYDHSFTVYECELVNEGDYTSGGSSGGVPNDPTPTRVPCVPVPTVLQGVEAIKGKIVVNVYNNGGGGSGGGGVAPEPCPVMPVDQTFGLNNSNAIVPEGNFAALIAYAKNHNLTVREPFQGSVIIDGIEYKGELTEIRDADGAIVSTYFHPDASSGPFQTGFHYNIGNKGPDGTSATNSPVSLPGFSNPPSYGSSPIIYAPTGSGSTGLSPTQRQALENADNIRLLQLLQQEDALDDALPSSCHGTARNGNVMWPGTAEHWLIQFDYIAEHPLALKEYYVPGSSGKLNGNPGYADIANPVTGEMFEIKPGNPNAQSAGATEIQLYVSQANALCPRVGGGGWSAGGNYSTRYLPDPRNPANLLEAKLSSNGVIVYGSKSRNGLPQPVPVALPQDMTEKLKRLSMRIKANPNTMQPQVITFVRENPSIIPYLKTAAAAVIIGTLLEDIITEGIGIADDWLSFLIARTLWRAGNGIIII